MSIRERKSYRNFEQQPTKKLCTEGDILIKRLATNQTKKHVELTRDLKEDDRFVSVTRFEPVTNYREGTCSAVEFREQCNNLDELEKLRSAGLSDSDIQFHMECRQNGRGSYKTIEKSALKDTIDRINGQIAVYESNLATTDPVVIRKNILLLEKPNSLQTRLLEFSLKNEKPNKKQLQLPIDSIKAIETDLFCNLPDNVKGIRYKTRKLNNRVSKIECQLETNAIPPTLAVNRETKWDIDQNVTHASKKLDAQKVYKCAIPNFYTVRNGEIIKLNNTYSSSTQISKEKITIDDIKKLPRFSNYQTGIPSKVIYIQNLDIRITENDLKSIFKLFAINIRSYRVLTGRLKGRAFITFNDAATCTAAFEKLNGTFVRNKPVVFVYGKKAPKEI